MVEIRIELQGRGVYLSGERLTCAITFSNSGGREETIAWAGAQLHCQLHTREDLVRMGAARPALPSPVTDTAFIPNKGERGQSILSSPTTVFLCNTSLQPGEARTVHYSEQVPVGGPPTFSGRLVKYSYKLAVGAQKPSSTAQITRLPFRVITIPESLHGSRATPSPQAANPFLATQEKEDPTLDLALQALAAETSRRTSLNYTLKNSGGVLGRLSLFKPAYKLGEDITGTFDLGSATVSCLQFSVVLQSVEEVAKECLLPTSPRPLLCVSHSRHQECCHNTALTHFALPVPTTVTQSFQDDLVTVRWQLHFEFLISRCSPDNLFVTQTVAGLAGSRSAVLCSLQPSAADSMTWNLPVTLLPSPSGQTPPSSTLTL